MVPHFELALAVDAEHGGAHSKEPVLGVQYFVGLEAGAQQGNDLCVRNIAKLRQAVGYPLGEYGGSLDKAANLLRRMAVEVVDPDHVVLLSPQLPHLLVLRQLALAHAHFVLLHGLLAAVLPLPHFAVPVV